MGRWTQFDEDSTRLPYGMKRVGYDADTSRYTFKDREGNTYMGPAHEEYGRLSLAHKASNPTMPHDDRPQAFASETSQPTLSISVPVQGYHRVDQGSTFQDILPPHLIASPSSSSAEDGNGNSTSSPFPMSGGARLRDAVRRSAVPAMQNVANAIRRSATSVRRPPRAQESEKDLGFLRASGRMRSNSVSGLSGKERW
ncbi:hypothetical protein R3P38DRAFT_2925358 [Favolaschia claudopus]|uniref:Carbohydrate-binding module family 50 protein n=1 Tax=Favolaschia claudopus TaxID=2862362 RepID=A0AAW0BY59_9AGAR